jgi:hypothetical protein
MGRPGLAWRCKAKLGDAGNGVPRCRCPWLSKARFLLLTRIHHVSDHDTFCKIYFFYVGAHSLNFPAYRPNNKSSLHDRWPDTRFG